LTEREEIERLWLRDNVSGPQRERWFHSAGCRRYLTLTRDTRTNAILSQPVQRSHEGAGAETTGAATDMRPANR
jgi:heterotetrameric sarcosine oxidase delta subunit